VRHIATPSARRRDARDDDAARETKKIRLRRDARGADGRARSDAHSARERFEF